MARKFLNRKLDEFGVDDEPRYNPLKVGPKVEAIDASDVQNRQITFGEQLQEQSQTEYEKTKEGLRWALDAAGNTAQYIRYFNLNMDKHQKQIDDKQKSRDKLDSDVASLQSYKLENYDLRKKPVSELNASEAKELIDDLFLEKRIIKNKIRTMKKEVAFMEDQYLKQDEKILELRRHLTGQPIAQNQKGKGQDQIETAHVVKNGLDSISKKYDVDKLSKTIDQILSQYRK